MLPDSNIYVDVDQEWRLIRETGDDLLIDGAAEKTGLAVIDLTTSDIPNEPWVIASESGEFIPAVAVSELVPGTTHGEGIESEHLISFPLFLICTFGAYNMPYTGQSIKSRPTDSHTCSLEKVVLKTQSRKFTKSIVFIMVALLQ